ncbi:Golgi-associated kinase 1A isoform X2 [Alosa sapidissima]|uniref:Golgi-associated kinase 1A isoform X2 n=1 Tax=Alosa sapidissima TaxID=34773 RepID=UPI001C095046|nr:Golgi-associated kinase 1A isoform X2 [Alosa sapidissima]
MALRSLMKICVKRRSVVTFLALFTLSVVLINTIPLFPTETMTLPPRDLKVSTSKRLPEGAQTTLLDLPPPHSGAWKLKSLENNAKHKFMTHHQRHRDVGVSKNIANEIHLDYFIKLRHRKELAPAKTKGKLSKREKTPSLHSNFLENKLFSGSSAIPFKQPLSHSVKAPAISQTAKTPDNSNGTKPCKQKCIQGGGGHESVAVGEAEKTQQTVREVSGEETAHEQNPEGFWKRRSHSLAGKESILRDQMRGEKSDLCQISHDKWNESTPESLPWLSADDVKKMALLSGGVVLSKARIPGHGQVLQVGLGAGETAAVPDHRQHCQSGSCALIKRPSDWFEVLAFHLDRVLELNRSLPSMLRNFKSKLLPYRYISGTSRPVVWWDPDIQHLAEVDNDQNSFSLSWPLYQKVLQSRCGARVSLNATPCVGVHHSEWGRLALFDFLLQVNDRLDRYCCGFRPDPSDVCLENMLHVKCKSPNDLLLVHILVRKADPSRLVFIDNAGRPHHPHDNLNFRLVEGIDEFPERAVSILQSGCLENMLLRSLSADRVLWESRGGAEGLRPIIRTIQQRGTILLQHIHNRRLRLNKDL